jgi:replicative DNA helicase
MIKDKKEIQHEREFIGLLLKHENLVEKFINSSLKVKDFDEDHQPILSSIIEAYERGYLLTRDAYRKKLKNNPVPKEKIRYELAFNSCYTCRGTDVNMFPTLMDEIREQSISGKLNDTLTKLQKMINDAGYKGALVEFHQDLGNLVADIKTDTEDKILYEETADIGDRYAQYVSDVLEGKIKPKPKILCGIPEIDETIVTGFLPGTLTLICAETRGFKSWMLLNIARSAWINGLNVAYVTIEMDEESVFKRKLSIETGIQHSQLYDEQNLKSEDLDKIRETISSWKEQEGKFRVLDLVGSIATVSNIRRLIKNDIDNFKPDIVVVDYISIMAAEVDRHNRYDLVIGDNAKGFRAMGKQLGCAVITAAQQKRESLAKRKKDPMDFGPEDISGSQELANDCDNIFYQRILPNRPHELAFKVVKVRNGKYTFPDGGNIARFDIITGTGKIISQSNSQYGECLIAEKEGSPIFEEDWDEQEDKMSFEGAFS